MPSIPSIPFYPEARRGYRTWRVLRGSPILHSMTMACNWPASTLTATCLGQPGIRGFYTHDSISPDEHCVCGIYALHNPWDDELKVYYLRPDWEAARQVELHGLTPLLGVDVGPIGAVDATGRMVVGSSPPRGFRAERARIRALAYCVPQHVELLGTSQFFHCARGTHVRPLTIGLRVGLETRGPERGFWSCQVADTQLRLGYPDVEIFSDITEMLVKYPPMVAQPSSPTDWRWVE